MMRPERTKHVQFESALTKLTTIVHNGVRYGVDQHARMTGYFDNVRPEYLLTVYIAESLRTHSNYRLAVRLEEPSRRIHFHILRIARGISALGKHGPPAFQRRKQNRSKRGRPESVDIFIEDEATKRCAIVEVKNFNPTPRELKKEVKRLSALMALESTKSPLQACYLAYPSHRLCDKLSGASTSAGIPELIYEPSFVLEETGDDGEDGFPLFYSHVLRIARKSTE
jgi:hypothetical protein